MNTIAETFISLIEKEKDEKFISFLKEITPAQKKELNPIIRKMAKEYNEFGSIGLGSWGHIKGTDKQRHMLQFASFVCFNRADYEKSHFSVWMLERTNLDRVIDWYVPEWFSDFVNKQAEQDFVPYYFSYESVMSLVDRGALQPSRLLIAKLLPNIIFERIKNNEWIIVSENLLRRPVTLHEHFWYLFEEETNIHYSDRYIFIKEKSQFQQAGWHAVIVQYCNEGKIDRLRLLKETLAASNKNFNKVLSGWFADLFVALDAKPEELFTIQKELFGVLGANHSKPVNAALKAIKEIITDKEFEIHSFLDTVPALLASDVKAVVNTTLIILEKLAKKYKAQAPQIAKLSCHVLVHADDSLQQRAAKLISTIYPEANDSIRQELEPYRETALSSARELLQHLFEKTEPAANNKVTTVNMPVVQTGLQAIPAIETIDDLIFLASQALDNNQIWHISILPAELVKLQQQIRKENIARFEPALQRALKLMRGGINSQQGYLDHMLALFLIDICIHWIRVYPGESFDLKELFEKADATANNGTKWLSIELNASYLAGWKHPNGIKAYEPYKELLKIALEKIRYQDSLPILSAPTHEPGWLDPLVLAKRMTEYINANKPPYGIDLQLAISRCTLDETADAIAFTEQNLRGEFKNLLLFLFDKDSEPQPPFAIPDLWMMASLTRKQKRIWPAFESFPWYRYPFNNYTGQLKWESTREDYTYSAYNYQTRKNEPVHANRKKMRVFKEKEMKEESGIKKFFQKITGAKTEAAQTIGIFDCMEFNAKWVSNESNDVKRILMLIPNNTEQLLAEFINLSLSDHIFSSEGDKKLITATLQLLHEIWKEEYGEMAHVFLGTCMLSGDKTIANIAGEIWINAVNSNTINNESLGEVIGRHESIEFAPLKRFTDLVMQQLFRISPAHNKALLIVIENILRRLPPEPINNLKKLLEIYAELISLQAQRKPDETVLYKLNNWKKSASVSKVAEKLLKSI